MSRAYFSIKFIFLSNFRNRASTYLRRSGQMIVALCLSASTETDVWYLNPKSWPACLLSLLTIVVKLFFSLGWTLMSCNTTYSQVMLIDNIFGANSFSFRIIDPHHTQFSLSSTYPTLSRDDYVQESCISADTRGADSCEARSMGSLVFWALVIGPCGDGGWDKEIYVPTVAILSVLSLSWYGCKKIFIFHSIHGPFITDIFLC